MVPKNQLTARVHAMLLLKQKVRDNDEMQSAIATEIEELETKQIGLQRKKRSLNTAYEKSNNNYAHKWNRKFAAKIFEVLTARELRDMIYCDLINGAPEAHIIQRRLPLPPNKPTWNEYFFHVPLNGRHGRHGRSRGLDNKLEHYFMKEYTGFEFAIEIAQVFHRYAVYNVRHVDDVGFLLASGPLMVHPSCKPLDYLRTLSVTVSMEPYFSSDQLAEAKDLQRKAEMKAKRETTRNS